MLTVLGPGHALAYSMAARRVQLPLPSSHIMSPGLASATSAVLFTLYSALVQLAMITFATAFTRSSARLVARTVLPQLSAGLPAENRPLLSMLPQAVLSRLQLTPVLPPVPVTVAVNCCVPLGFSVTLPGLMLTTGGGSTLLLSLPPRWRYRHR